MHIEQKYYSRNKQKFVVFINLVRASILMLCLTGFASYSQSNIPDSIQATMKGKSKLEKAMLYLDLSEKRLYHDTAETKIYLDEFSKLKIEKPEFLKKYILITGQLLFLKREFPQAYVNFEEGLQLVDYEGFDSVDFLILKEFANVLVIANEKDSAIRLLDSAIKELQKSTSVNSYTKMLILEKACIYANEGFYEEMNQTLNNYANRKGNVDFMDVRLKSLLGFSYILKEEYDSAQIILQQALSLGEAVSCMECLFEPYNYLAILKDSLREYKLAHKFLTKPLEIGTINSDQRCEMNFYRGLLLFKQNNLSESEIKIKQALLEMPEFKFYHSKQKAYDILYKIEYKRRNYEESYQYLEKAIYLDSLIHRSAADRKFSLLELKYEFDKKEREIELLRKENNIKEVNISEHRAFVAILIIGLILLICVFAFSYYKYKVKKKVNQEIVAQNKLIDNQKEEIENQNAEILEQTKLIEEHLGKLEIAHEELLKLSTVANQADNAIMIISPTGNIEWVNNGFKKMYGYSLEEFKEVKGKSIFDASANIEIKKDISYCISNKQSVVYFSKNITKNGREKWIQTTLTPITNEEGHLEKLVAVDSDYTQLKMAENEIKIAKKAEEAFRIKNELLANMSNEILAPLKYIIANTKRLSKELPEKEYAAYVDTILSNGYSLRNLINDILDYSKLQSMRIAISPSKTDVAKLLDEVCEYFQPKIFEKGLSIFIDKSPEIAQFYNIDKKRVRQVLFNLFSNAVKFTENGFVKMAVRQASNDNTQQKSLVFLVEDSGIGMSSIDRKEIFNVFSQASCDSDRKYGGTGLGLAICKQLIDAMGGQIEIESKQEKGTIVLITIPINEPLVDEGEIGDAPVENYMLEEQPVETNNDVINVDELKKQLLALDNESLLKLIDEDAAEIKQFFEKAYKTKSIGDIKQFAVKLKFLSQTYKLNLYFDFQEQLLKAVYNFDIRSINVILKGFAEIINVLDKIESQHE